MNPQIDLIYIDSGGGHRAAAGALAEVIRRQSRSWDVTLRSIQDLLDPIDFIRKWTGIPFEDVYNIMLRRGWTFGTAQLIPLMHLLIRLLHRAQVRVLEQHWRTHRPDMVVSLIPHYNRALRESLDRVWPGTPLITVLTDIADYPPHFWIEGQDQYVVCGSDKAVEQARDLGLPESRIMRVSGMILNPRFYADGHPSREAGRVALGLRPDLPTALVMFGGEGSRKMLQIAGALSDAALQIQVIFLCGRNEELAAQLRALPVRMPIHVCGFTSDVPYYMSLADFFIGKAGPGSISEALAMRLPVIVERNAWTLVHERYNADWILEKNFGIVLQGFSQIGEGVRRMLCPETYRTFREAAAATHNRAVFEIPDLLEKVLAHHTGASPEALPDMTPVAPSWQTL
jgi:1,2-diacylglycerol 3-beta-galactosyltransferase